MRVKYNFYDNINSGNIEEIRRAFKKFARRHGLTPDEVGKRESRTMDYKVDFPNKEKRISAIKIGYNNGVDQKSREIKNPVYKKPISRSSKWIKTKNDSENPFENKF